MNEKAISRKHTVRNSPDATGSCIQNQNRDPVTTASVAIPTTWQMEKKRLSDHMALFRSRSGLDAANIAHPNAK